MTSQFPESHKHIEELLPAYLTDRLDEVDARQVHEHLVSCETCQRKLTVWRSVKEATRLVQVSAPQPPLPAPFMNAVWTKIDDPTAKAQATRFGSPRRTFYHFWQVLRAQFPLIHKSTWIASALVCLF